jgi:hypothetical protein
MIKSRQMRWARNVACMMEIKCVYRTDIENLKGRDYLENIGLDSRIILKCMF